MAVFGEETRQVRVMDGIQILGIMKVPSNKVGFQKVQAVRYSGLSCAFAFGDRPTF